jgi:hypothetical protein
MAGLVPTKWTLTNQQDIGVLKWKQRQTLSKVLYEHYDLIVRDAHHGSQDFLPNINMLSGHPTLQELRRNDQERLLI